MKKVKEILKKMEREDRDSIRLMLEGVDSENGFHHEIYLFGFSRSGNAPESKFKTILRQPVMGNYAKLEWLPFLENN